MAGAVAHDVRNLLTVVRGYAGILEESVEEDADSRDALEGLLEGVDRLALLVGRFQDATRPQALSEPEEVDLDRLITAELRLLGQLPLLESIRLEPRLPHPIAWSTHRLLLVQALDNLVINAAEATGAGGRIEVHLVRDSEGTVFVEVHDDGPGIPVDQRHRVLEPLFTTKPQGTGLGMVAVRAAAAAHGGKVEIVDSPLGGACVRIVLGSALRGELDAVGPPVP